MKTHGKYKISDYSTLATAFLLLQNTGNAQVIYSDIEPDIEISLTGDQAFIDIDGNTTIDFNFLKTSVEYYFWNGASSVLRERKAIWCGVNNSMNGIMGISSQASEGGPIGYYPHAFLFDELINSALTFQNYYFQIMALGFYDSAENWHYGAGAWREGIENGYLGIRFINNGGFINYGWIRCTTTDHCNKLIIKDFAYESKPNQGILAGDTVSYVPIVEINNLNAVIYSFDNTIQIQLPISSNNKHLIEVFNAEGKLVYRNETTQLLNSITLNVGTGVYIVQVSGDPDTYREGKMIKKVFLN